MLDIILTYNNLKKLDFHYKISDAVSQECSQDEFKIPKKVKLIIFDFWNESCTYCGQQEFLLKQIEEKHKTNFLSIYKLNVDYEGNYQFIKNYPIRQLPSLLFINVKLKKVFFFSGLTNLDVIDYFINNIDKKKRCINCKKILPSKQKRGNLYYCKKRKDYVHYKDSC